MEEGSNRRVLIPKGESIANGTAQGGGEHGTSRGRRMVHGIVSTGKVRQQHPCVSDLAGCWSAFDVLKTRILASVCILA